MGLFWPLELANRRAGKAPLRRFTGKYSLTVVPAVAGELRHKHDTWFPADKFGIWVVPPLIVTAGEIDFLVDAIDSALAVTDRQVEP